MKMLKYCNGDYLGMIIQEIKGDDEERIYCFLVRKSEDSRKYIAFVDLTDYKAFCSCMGFSIRKMCSHMNEVLKFLENDKRLSEKDKKLLDAEVNENWQ